MNRSVFSSNVQYNLPNEDEKIATLLKKQREKIESIKSEYWQNKDLVERYQFENEQMRVELDQCKKQLNDLTNLHERTLIQIEDDNRRLSSDNYYKSQELSRYQIMGDEANKNIDLWKHEYHNLKENLENRAHR